jgi:hypothetical protein
MAASARFRIVGLAGCVAALLASQAPAKSPALPKNAPVPQLNQTAAPEAPAVPPASAPVPQQRPDAAPPASEPPTPRTTPTPPENPAGTEIPPGTPKPPEKRGTEKLLAPIPAPSVAPSEPADEKEPLADPRSAMLPLEKMPTEEIACRERLKMLGAVFEERKAEHDAEIGCSVPYPLTVSKLGRDIAITPDAELNCTMAEAVGRFAADMVSPAARA